MDKETLIDVLYAEISELKKRVARLEELERQEEDMQYERLQ